MADPQPLVLEGEVTLVDQPGRYWGFVVLGPDEATHDLAQRAAVHFGLPAEGRYALALGRVRVTVELLEPPAGAPPAV